jgi:hypothetical protein
MDDTRSSGAGVELAPALPEARPPIRARTSEPAHFGDPTGTVGCEVGVGECRWRSWQRQQRPCITGASRARRLAAFRGIADRRETGWLSQIRRPDDSWGEGSGLQACYRKAPFFAGLFHLKSYTVHHRCITMQRQGSETPAVGSGPQAPDYRSRSPKSRPCSGDPLGRPLSAMREIGSLSTESLDGRFLGDGRSQLLEQCPRTSGCGTDLLPLVTPQPVRDDRYGLGTPATHP